MVLLKFKAHLWAPAVAATAIFMVFSVTPAAIADHHQMAIHAAIENANRDPANVARDPDRKAAEVVEFFAVKPGDVVLDLFSGGGYFSEVYSGLVGKDGRVYAHHRAGERFEKNKEKLAAHYAKFGNISLLVSADGTFDLPDDSVDLVMLSLIIHHLHYSEDTPDVLPEASKALYAEIQRVLKPGGTFALIEHAAPKGASRKDSNDWHRIPPEMAIADLTSVGFKYVGSADIHNNPEDAMNFAWGPAGMRGKTTRLVQKYTSPH